MSEGRREAEKNQTVRSLIGRMENGRWIQNRDSKKKSEKDMWKENKLSAKVKSNSIQGMGSKKHFSEDQSSIKVL